MAAVIFTEILKQGIAKGMVPARTLEAREWYRKTAMKTSGARANPAQILKTAKGQSPSKTQIGGIYMFSYDPKEKKTLPYYDTFPVVIPIEPTSDGFLGLNMHYLPPKYRAFLMDRLMEVASDDRYDENTKLQLSYSMLKKASRYRYFEPCLKRYLNKHIRSRMIEVPADQWDIALFLPLERFQKANKRVVYAESINKVK